MRINFKIHYHFISLLVLLPFIFPCCSYADEFAHVSSEEALFVRRILEFWRDKDNALVKSQIEQFLHQYPHSEYKDSLLVILGDTLWQEKKYESALKIYTGISKPQYQDKVYNNCLDCLYHLGRYQEITHMLPSKVSQESLDFSDEQQALWAYYQAEALLNLAKNNPENRAENLEQAKKYFEQLQNTKHKLNAKLGLAEIESLNGNAEQVVQHYLDLADIQPEKQDEMLFRAAQLQAQYDPEIALTELGRIQNLYGEFSSQAALSRLGILFDLGKYQQIIDEKPEFFKALKNSQHPILYLYIGRSHFNLNQYEEALNHFLLLDKPEYKLLQEDPHTDKNLIIMKAVCANRLHNLELASSLRQKFKEQYPQDPALADLLYYEALTFAHFHQYPEAIVNLEIILREYPDNEFYEDVLYEKSFALYKIGKWQESRTGFAQFIKKNSDSKLFLAAVKTMPYLDLQLLDEAENQSGQDANQARELLIEDLRRVLSYPEELGENQQAKYTLQLGKVFYDLHSYQEAIDTLIQYIDNYPQDENLYQGYLLLALCYYEGSKDSIQFAVNAEKVLMVKPDFADKTRLHLNLFNAYIEMTKDADDKEGLYDLAAHHLYEAINDSQAIVKQENLLWLANYHYQKIRRTMPDYEIEPLEPAELKSNAEKALAIYKKALNNIEDTKFQLSNIYLEGEYFKLSNLYGWLNQAQDQKKLLKSFIVAQNAAPELNWKFRARALFAYANANLFLNENQEALENYHLLFTSRFSDSYIVNASKLRWARLAYISLPDSKKVIDDPDMMAILKTLKDVQIHKILQQEPIHLEAGIDYAKMRSSLEPLEKRHQQQLFLLKRMKEDFNGRDDLWSRDYAEARNNFPEKNSIAEAYLNLIDAHINLLESKLADQHNPELKGDKLEKAKSLYQNLLTENGFSTKYLKHHAESGLRQIESKDDLKDDLMADL